MHQQVLRDRPIPRGLFSGGAHSHSLGPQLSTWHMKLLRQPQLCQPRAGGRAATAARGSTLLLLPHPLAAPGVNGFAFHPLGGALRVRGTLTPAHRRVLWQPRSRVPSVLPEVCGMRSLARAEAKRGDPQ